MAGKIKNRKLILFKNNNMKNILFCLTIFLISIGAMCQRIDTVTVSSLTLRAQDWAWLVGKYGEGADSTSKVKIRAIREQMRAANPATWAANVAISNIPGNMTLWMYNAFNNAAFGEVFNMGSTQAERVNIYTQIRAINNSALQYFIGVIDGQGTTLFIRTREFGKHILLDN